MAVKSRDCTGKCSRLIEVIGVEPADKISARNSEGLVEAIGRSAIAATYDPYSRVALFTALELLQGAIGGAAGCYEELKALRLLQN